MGYQVALESAGAEVVEYIESGDYQGTWLALVHYKGKMGWVHGEYGSCSGCDAFAAEFDDISHHHDDEYIYLYNLTELYDPNCGHCVAHKERLADFGEQYLDDIKSTKEMYEYFSKDASWDMEIAKLLKTLDRYMNMHDLIQRYNTMFKGEKQ